MSSGLDAIKSVGALLSAEQQLNSCLNRMKEAKKYIFDFEKGDKEAKENESKKEVRTILVQMVLSAFRGNSATVGIAAERAVSALFIASELHGIASSVVQQTGEDRKCEAKKSVARKEEEREMCHEDREFLKGLNMRCTLLHCAALYCPVLNSTNLLYFMPCLALPCPALLYPAAPSSPLLHSTSTCPVVSCLLLTATITPSAV